MHVKLRDGRSFRASYAPVPGWRSIEVDRAAWTVALPEGAELDLGATAKALAADRAALAAAEASGTGVLVSLGGDISIAGPLPDGGWPVRIADDQAVAAGRARAGRRAHRRRSRHLGHARALLARRRGDPPPHRRPAHRAPGRDALADRDRRGRELRRRERRQHRGGRARRRGARLARRARPPGAARPRVG